MDKQFGKYKVVREIGKGGMGVVYKALDPVTQATVAIKVLPAANVDRTTVERFNREAQAMAKVRHSNLIEIYDHGMSGGEHFLVMEYVDGDSLKNFLKHHEKLSVTECLEMSAQITDVLIRIHGEGMIHRDLKPGNIMITSGARIKLMDFGLVHIPGVTRVTVEGSSVGTPEYMSPEQISDQGVDTRSDIYSLGVTMYEMLAGHPPFQAQSVQAVLVKQKNEQAPSLRSLRPDVPMELELIIMKAMCKDIAQRYQHVEELFSDIQKLKGQNAKPYMAGESAKTLKAPEAVVPQAGSSFKVESCSNVGPRRSKAPLVGAFLILAVLVSLGYVYRRQWSPYAAPVIQKIQASLTGKARLADATEEILIKLEQAEGHYARAKKLSRQDDWVPAIQEFQQAIQLRGDYGLYYWDLAAAFEQNKEHNQAIATWQDLLRHDPTSSYADKARKKITELTGQ